MEEQRMSMYDFHIDYKGNLDLAVLRERVPTHVTPRIGKLASQWFKEKLYVVGRRPREAERPESEGTKNELSLRLQGFLMRTQTRRLVQFRPNQRIGNSRWLKHILIDGVKYEVRTGRLLLSCGLKVGLTGRRYCSLLCRGG